MKNRYFYRSHLNEAKFRKIIECFTNDLTASTTAKFTRINRNTINSIFKLIRERIFKLSRIIIKRQVVLSLMNPILEQREFEERQERHQYLVY